MLSGFSSVLNHCACPIFPPLLSLTSSPGLGLEIGSNAYPSDALLFFCDVDMIFTRGFLDRVRRATKKNRQVFFPIVYSQYDPRWVYNSEDAQAEIDFVVHVPFQNLDDSDADSNLPKHLRNPYLISKNSGYWRQFGFGIAALYNCDFRQAGERLRPWRFGRVVGEVP